MLNSQLQKPRRNRKAGSLLKVIPFILHPCVLHKKDHTQKHTHSQMHTYARIKGVCGNTKLLHAGKTKEEEKMLTEKLKNSLTAGATYI